MSSTALRFVSYVALALVGDHGSGAHDVARGVRQGGRIYGDVAPSQIYAELKRLARLGLLDARSEPGQTTARTVYRLTPAGREALIDYLREPSPFPRLRQEVTLRLLAGDMLTDEEIVTSVTGMRSGIAEMSAVIDEMEQGAVRVPHRTRYLMLQHDLARRLLDVYEAWVDDVEQALSPPRSRPRRSNPAGPSGEADAVGGTGDA